jgi:hypothetical protein
VGVRERVVRLEERVRADTSLSPPGPDDRCPRCGRTDLAEPDVEQLLSLAAVAEAQVLVIDNVAEYFYAGTSQEEWDPKEEFPCVAPPYPVFWMEYRRPSRILSTDYGVKSSAELAEECGFLFSVEEPVREVGEGGLLALWRENVDFGNLTENASLNWGMHGAGLARAQERRRPQDKASPVERLKKD